MQLSNLVLIGKKKQFKGKDNNVHFITFDTKLNIMKKEIKKLDSALTGAYHQLEKIASRTDGLSGIPSGFKSLDKMTSGWQNGELIAIGARPAMGKTAFVLSMLKNITVDLKIPAMLFSLEMTETHIVNRMIANVCEIPSEKIRSGQLAPYEWAELDYKIKELYDAPLYIDTTPALRIEDLCEMAVEAVKTLGVKLIVIDYIQLLYNEIKYTDNRYLDLNYFTRRLKSLAKELNIPIIITSQLNRDFEKREDTHSSDVKRPRLTDLRDSGTICDDCDIVLFLHRPEYYRIYVDDKGTDLRGMAEVIIAKHRNGVLGDILLRFRGEFARFQNPDDDMLVLVPGEEPGTIRSRINSNGDIPPLPSSDCENLFDRDPFNDPIPF